MYVYFILTTSPPIALKVGKARRPRQRLGELQVGSFLDLEIMGAIKCRSDAEARQLEQHVHSALASLRLRGEWYQWTEATRAKLYSFLGSRSPTGPVAFRFNLNRRGKARQSRFCGLVFDEQVKRYWLNAEAMKGSAWHFPLCSPGFPSVKAR